MDVASKMPLIISLLLPAKAENNSRKNARTPQKIPDKNNAMFLEVQGYMAIFTITKGQPFIHDCP
jgi:hypothetical protein